MVAHIYAGRSRCHVRGPPRSLPFLRIRVGRSCIPGATAGHRQRATPRRFRAARDVQDAGGPPMLLLDRIAIPWVFLATSCSLGLPGIVQPAPADAGKPTTVAASTSDARAPLTCAPMTPSETKPVVWRPPAGRRAACGASQADEIGRCTANAYDLHGCDHMKKRYPECWACAVSDLGATVHSAVIADTTLDGFWPNHAGCVATESGSSECGRDIYFNDMCGLQMCDHCNNDGWEDCLVAASTLCDARYAKTCAGPALERCGYSKQNEEHFVALVTYFCGG